MVNKKKKMEEKEKEDTDTPIYGCQHHDVGLSRTSFLRDQYNNFLNCDKEKNWP